MQDKRKSSKANNKEEIVVEENINKAIEKDKKIVAKESSSTSLKEKIQKVKKMYKRKLFQRK